MLIIESHPNKWKKLVDKPTESITIFHRKVQDPYGTITALIIISKPMSLETLKEIYDLKKILYQFCGYDIKELPS